MKKENTYTVKEEFKGSPVQFKLPFENSEKIDIRRKNIIYSPKFGGSGEIDAKPYLKELGIEIEEKRQPIQFTSNFGEHVHRWAPYIQGFSASFVQSILERYGKDYRASLILDPFAGCGTVLVQSKLNNYKSIGTELNPLLQFIADIKVNSWDVDPKFLMDFFLSIPRDLRTNAPKFLKSDKQFNKGVLKNLEFLKGGIDSLPSNTGKTSKAKNIILLAFASILIDCSNLKRSPCLGYSKNKRVSTNSPWTLIEKKVKDICHDLVVLQKKFKKNISVKSKVILANAMEYKHNNKYDLIVTSPPYMNGLDYVMNYKIEMGWLGFTNNHKEAKRIKDEMVVCDNVSKGLIRGFSKSNSRYSNDWLDDIMNRIERNIARRGNYRRIDMPFIVAKYFDDLYQVMRKVVPPLCPGGRFLLVIGDSLIADVYIPTDLILAKMGQELGLEIEKIEKARNRRSGQVRSYRLRETVLTLRKGIR